MIKMGALHFHPERIAWIGAALLGAGFLCSLPAMWMLVFGESPATYLRSAGFSETHKAPLTFSLSLNDKGPILPIPELHGEMTFSFDPPRPIGMVGEKRLLVRMKKSASSRKVSLPCRLDLEFQGNQLVFANHPSSFWIELVAGGGEQIIGKAYIASLDGETISAGNFSAVGQECPIQQAQEFAPASPFRVLAEARWWGRDQFRDPKECGERIEVGELLEVKENEWLVWKDQKWQKSALVEKEGPIAHVQSQSGKTLVLEGWDSDGHVRIALNGAEVSPFKVRGEDLLGSIRVRSEKQISCMLEKQCMVLKTGDWVLKTSGRWKVLRKKEERDAFQNGKLFGELFVFEQISQKQGQKMVLGRLFNPGRTQVLPIEVVAQSGRKAMGKGRKSS